MTTIDKFPSEILAEVFAHEGLSDIARRVCSRWRGIALPIWQRRLVVLPSNPFKDRGLLDYLQTVSFQDSIYVRALEISSRRESDTTNNTAFFTEVADILCFKNLLRIQTLLGSRVTELAITDVGWTLEHLLGILQRNLYVTHHLTHLQFSLFQAESFVTPELERSMTDLFHRDSSYIKYLSLDLAQTLTVNTWLSIAECTEINSFHLGLQRSSEPILEDILRYILPKWTTLNTLSICQPRSLSPGTLTLLRDHLPRPNQLRELHLIFEACQASSYEQEFLDMIHVMPNLQILVAHLDWTNRMMEHIAMTLLNLRELSIATSNINFTCSGIDCIAWGQELEKVNMRTSGKIWSGFLTAIRKRSRRVKILVYGSMKWGGSVDEWE